MRISLIQRSDTSNKDDGTIHFETAVTSTLLHYIKMTVDGYHLLDRKAWCTANGTGTVAIIDSHNISSLSRSLIWSISK